MKGVLYLGRISNHKEYSENNVKCFSITLSDKFNSYMDKLDGLAPSRELWQWNEENKDRENFKDGYYKMYYGQVKSSDNAQKDIKYVCDLLDKGQDVALICFCGTYLRCHRGILGEWFEKKGYEVIYR